MPILQCNEESLDVCVSTVEKVYSNGMQSVLRITSDSGKSVEVTADHQFLFENGWASLKDATGLTVSDNFASIAKYPRFYEVGTEGDLVLAKTISVEFVGNAPVYDLEIASPYHNFIAEGFVVHNSKPVALEPIGEEGGYSYFGPPADFGGSYGSYSDGENTIVSPMAEEVYSPMGGSKMKFVGPVSYEDVAKALKSSKFSNLLHSCVSCGSAYVTSSDSLKEMNCYACGASCDYASALMRGRRSRKDR